MSSLVRCEFYVSMSGMEESFCIIIPWIQIVLTFLLSCGNSNHIEIVGLCKRLKFRYFLCTVWPRPKLYGCFLIWLRFLENGKYSFQLLKIIEIDLSGLYYTDHESRNRNKKKKPISQLKIQTMKSVYQNLLNSLSSRTPNLVLIFISSNVWFFWG